jgi:hypothetical protein
MNKRLRISAVLILIGLVIELFSLTWTHPLSFMLFLFLGGLLMAAGIIIYLISLTIDSLLLSDQDKQ